MPTLLQRRRVYQYARWSGRPVCHGFGTRGVSVEAYLRNAHEDSWSIPTTRQVHSPIAMDLTPPLPRMVLVADAFVTATPGVVCMVRTADCVPLLLYEPVRGVVAAIHAGWRGLAAGVIANTVQLMCERFGGSVARIEAAIGPAIRGAEYEVDRHVIEAMRAGGHDIAAGVLSRTGRGAATRWQLDLPTLAWQALLRSGIMPDAIGAADVSTVTHQGDFASFRRDELGSTRQVNWIALL